MYLSDHKLVPLVLTLIEHLFELVANLKLLERDRVLEVDPGAAGLVEPLRGTADLHDVVGVEIVGLRGFAPLTLREGQTLLTVVLSDY